MRGVMLCLLFGAALAVTPAAEKKIALPEDNPMAQLRPGPGADVARANCVACHSTDYIVRQPGRTAQQWEAEVKKMVTVFGAPISEDDIKIIVSYLADAYGPASATPGAVPPAKSAQKPTARQKGSASGPSRKPAN